MGSMSIMGDRGRLTTCLTLGFRALPHYGNDMRKQYNLIMSQLAGSNMLAFITSQIKGVPTSINKMEDLSADILEADYALT